MTRSPTEKKRSLDGRLLSEARRIAPGLLIASLMFNVLPGGVVIFQALLLSQTIYRVFLLKNHLDEVLPLLLAVLVIVALRAILAYPASRTSAELAIRVKYDLRQRLVSQFGLSSRSWMRAERSGDLVLTATEGIEKLDGYYRDYLPGILAALFQPLIILLVVLPLDALTFLVLLITAPLIPFFMALIGMAAGILAKRQFLEMRFLGAHFLDVMQGLNTLKLFNRSQYQVETIRQITGQFRESTMRVLRVAFISAFTLEMLATLSVAMVAVEIGVRLLHGGIAFDQALFLLMIAPEFYLPLRALGAKFHNATGSKAAAERIFEMLDLPLPGLSSAADLPVPDVLHIRFEAVSLSYENGTRPALKNISLDIKPGEHVALVGASGSGKTTLASLLLRFVEPAAGFITVDGQDLSRISAEQWRSKIAWVSQSPYLLNTTVAENIRFSRPDASEEQTIAAAQAAGAHEFILQLPEGYQTLCGERGLRLSGGQVQRIALARALLRDAPLLILDEPTSQLDPENETGIMQTLHRLTQGRTVLLITHRLNTIILADRLYLLHEGQLTEQGTHDDLIAPDSDYAGLIKNDGIDADEV